ncbi:MAG: bacterial transcriptional activator domain-containing protein, partial [Hyphomicrobiaceae bacterium]
AHFEALCADGTPEALSQADQIYSGELLDGLSIPEAEWENWLAAERSRLRGMILDARSKLAGQLLADARYEEALDVTQRAIALDPLREDSRRSMMLALAGLGRRAEALRCFEDLVTLLTNELGAAPDAETVRVGEVIRSASGDQESSDCQADSSAPAESPQAGTTPDGLDETEPDVTEVNVGIMPNSLSVFTNSASPAKAETVPNSAVLEPGSQLARLKRHRIALITACIAATCVITAVAAWLSGLGQTASKEFGPRLLLVTGDQHQKVLGGSRIDLRVFGFEPLSVRIHSDRRLDLEWLRNVSLRQRLQADVGTWRSKSDQFCMTFKWYYHGRELCTWILRDGSRMTAIGPEDRPLPWVIRDPVASRTNRLQPPASEAGKLLKGERLRQFLPGIEIYTPSRSGPTALKLLAGGQMEIEVLTVGKKGKQYELDHGTWRIENDRLCLKPGWWQDGREKCFGIRAGSYAYILTNEHNRPTAMLIRK